ncbi:MAG: hypothetical protein QME51_09525 [Planctomycetota bacterium]|nr:hypothetical protein [Planctomycetota bacterium]MDI6788597.1 hypothetical protein [Planctomycetota bacterium]
MVRFANIFKQPFAAAQDKPDSKKDTPAVPPVIPEKVRLIRAEEDERPVSPAQPTPMGEVIEHKPGVSFSDSMRQTPETLSKIFPQDNEAKSKKAHNLYQQLSQSTIKIIGEVHTLEDLKKPIYSEFLTSLNEAINFIITGERALLDLTNQSVAIEQLKYHSMNVGIISLYLGLSASRCPSGQAGRDKKYNKSNLVELGCLAFLHELKEVIAPLPQKMPPVPETSTPIFIGGQFHPTLSELKNTYSSTNLILQYLMNAPNVFGVSATLRHSATPQLKRDPQEILGYIDIIRLADTYETLCHPGLYRKKMSPHLVIKQLINSSEDLDRNLVRMLVRLVGMYPVGSCVRLNTSEIGWVVRGNSEAPLRPTVQIIPDEEMEHDGFSAKEKQPYPKIIDLATNQLIYIANILSDNSQDAISGTSNPK